MNDKQILDRLSLLEYRVAYVRKNSTEIEYSIRKQVLDEKCKRAILSNNSTKMLADCYIKSSK